MEAGDLLDSVKFSEGIKKPSGQDHTAAEGNYVIKASCRKKEARKTGIFLTLKKEWHQETALVLEKPDRCKHQNTAGELATGECLMKENPTGENGKNGFQAHQQRSHGGI